MTDFNRKGRARTANLLGALALALTDRMRDATEAAAGRGAAGPAAIIQIGTNQGESIDALRRTLGLSHSATVRLVERLQEDGLVAKLRGTDARVAELTLTAAGQAIMAEILGQRQKVLGDALDGLTQAEWRAMTGLIEKILPNLVASQYESDHACRLCDEASCPQDHCPAGFDA